MVQFQRPLQRLRWIRSPFQEGLAAVRTVSVSAVLRDDGQALFASHCAPRADPASRVLCRAWREAGSERALPHVMRRLLCSSPCRTRHACMESQTRSPVAAASSVASGRADGLGSAACAVSVRRDHSGSASMMRSSPCLRTRGVSCTAHTTVDRASKTVRISPEGAERRPRRRPSAAVPSATYHESLDSRLALARGPGTGTQPSCVRNRASRSAEREAELPPYQQLVDLGSHVVYGGGPC